MSKKLKYPYKWGAGIVDEFVNSYARATYLLSKLTERSPGEVRHWLIMALCSGNSVRYESCKQLIKALSHYELSDFAKFSLKERKNYLTYLKYLAEDDALDNINRRKVHRDTIDNLNQKRLEF